MLPAFHGSGSGGETGFSLAEILVAMSILVIGLTGILSSLPLALGTASGSSRETRATLIVQSLISEIKGGKGGLRLFVSKKNAAGSDDTSRLDLNKDGDGDVHHLIFDADGNPSGEVNAAAYEKGNPDGIFIARIKAVCNFPRPGLCGLTISIEWPASVSVGKRQKRNFATLILPNV